MIYDDLPWIDIIQNTVEQWNKISQEMYEKDFNKLSDNDKQWVWDEFIYQSHPKATAEEAGKALNTLIDKLEKQYKLAILKGELK